MYFGRLMGMVNGKPSNHEANKISFKTTNVYSKYKNYGLFVKTVVISVIFGCLYVNFF